MIKVKAFSLIELLIAMVIVGILSAIAYPLYNDHILRAARADAYIGIQNMAVRLERHYAIRNAYTAIPATTSPDGYYTISAVTGIATESNCANALSDTSSTFAYSIIARPISGERQGADKDCDCYLLTSTGVKGSVDSSGNSSDCW